jgi:hypothetical protein
VIEEHDLRAAAPMLDRMLRECPYQTLVHGDAKLANFCFAKKNDAVAAVDFQYVGRGCGMKDVAYLISGTPDEQRHLDGYFRALRDACKIHRHDVDGLPRSPLALSPSSAALPPPASHERAANLGLNSATCAPSGVDYSGSAQLDCASALEGAWRALYPIACADFYRFMAGWSKAHWSRDRPAQRLVRDVLSKLHTG